MPVPNRGAASEFLGKRRLAGNHRTDYLVHLDMREVGPPNIEPSTQMAIDVVAKMSDDGFQIDDFLRIAHPSSHGPISRPRFQKAVGQSVPGSHPFSLAEHLIERRRE